MLCFDFKWLIKLSVLKPPPFVSQSTNCTLVLVEPCCIRNGFDCTDEKHLKEIENLYAELTSALLAAASSAIETTGKKNEGKFKIPGWNLVVKSKHQIAKAAFQLWVNCNRPMTGNIYKNMTKTKKDFKYSLQQCRKDVEIHKA